MKLRFSHILLIAAALGVAALLVMVFTGKMTWFSTSPPIEIQPNLDHQFKAIPQSPNTFFADGKSMREPVAGIVDTSMYPVYTMAPGDVDSAEKVIVERTDITEIRKPRDAKDTLLLARGQNRFNTFCSPCHNYDAKSQSKLVKRGSWAGIPDLTREQTVQLSNKRIFHIISAGQGLMPSYADKLDEIDRWAVIRYLRRLQGLEDKPATETPVTAQKK